jgi:nitroimidazol reductase NimA-like FMN-containing flavoprotein (pyridoxamine 5'-phosphate oxidase superfamily)
MLIHQLTPAECRLVLSQASVARLACSHADQPYIVPISFAFDVAKDALFGFSTVGKKIEWMRMNPKICLEVEDITDRFHWQTVVVLGRYEEISDAPENAEERTRMLNLLDTRDEWWFPGAARFEAQEHHAVVIYRIHIDSITGRRADRNRV